MASYLSNVDNFWLSMDHPTNLMVIVGILELDRPVDYGRLCQTVDQRLLGLTRFKQRVVHPVGGVGLPHWERDPYFDVRSHVHRVALPSPGDQGALQELVGDLMTTPLDATRPLWQMHLIEGWGRGSAILARIHHCIADGIALIHVLLSLTDLSASSAASRETSTRGRRRRRSLLRTMGRTLSRAEAVGERLWHDWIQVVSAPDQLLGAARTATHLTVDSAATVSKLLRLKAAPKTVFKGRLGVHKAVTWSEPIPLAEVKVVGRATGATVNDVLIATIAGALRRYLRRRREAVDELDLQVMIPVNIRPADKAFELGNRFSLVFLGLPVMIKDPLERLREVKRRMDALKRSPDAFVGYQTLTALGRSPENVAKKGADFFSRKATAVLTNVPGPRQPLFLCGRKITNMMFWVPRSGRLGLGLSIISYDGRVTLGIVVDSGLVPDPAQLARDYLREFEHLKARAPRRASTAEFRQRKFGHTDAQCSGQTRAGARCRKRAQQGKRYCALHAR